MNRMLAAAAALIAVPAAAAPPPPPLIALSSTRFRSDIESCLARRLPSFGTPAVIRIDQGSRIEFGAPRAYLWVSVRPSGLTRWVEVHAEGPMYDRFAADVAPCF